MNPSQSESEFRKRLGQSVEETTPRQGFETMFAFYADQRAKKVKVEESGDMLLFEWGVYSFTGPESFQLGLTRQFMVSGEDEPCQLHLTFHFEPTDALRTLGEDNKWCESPAELPAFKECVAASSPFQLLADSKAPRAELYFDLC